MASKHLLIMLACCLIPVMGLGAAWVLGVPLGMLGIVALILLCPLGHFFLMRGMGHGGSKHSGGSADHEPQRP